MFSKTGRYPPTPKRCPTVPGWVIPEIAGGCVVSTFVTATLGNPDLTTEKSESASVGIEVDVFDNHEVSLDCWKVDVHDKILTAQTAWIIRHEDALTKVEGLQVTARTSSFAFKGRNEDVRRIGEELGVAGASFVVLLFVAFVIRGFQVARRAVDSFGSLLALGLTLLALAL